MTAMEDKDSIELFIDSMKKAESCARQLTRLTKIKDWIRIAEGFKNCRLQGEQIYRMPSPSQAERVKMIDRLVEKMANAQGSSAVQ